VIKKDKSTAPIMEVDQSHLDQVQDLWVEKQGKYK
jgi:hypothetical protein